MAGATVVVPTAGAQTYIISGGDGYGTTECLASGAACGKIIADSWCESKGFQTAREFRMAQPEDITGSAPARGGREAPQAFVIVCGR
jgi:hypothetical protein